MPLGKKSPPSYRPSLVLLILESATRADECFQRSGWDNTEELCNLEQVLSLVLIQLCIKKRDSGGHSLLHRLMDWMNAHRGPHYSSSQSEIRASDVKSCSFMLFMAAFFCPFPKGGVQAAAAVCECHLWRESDFWQSHWLISVKAFTSHSVSSGQCCYACEMGTISIVRYKWW